MGYICIFMSMKYMHWCIIHDLINIIHVLKGQLSIPVIVLITDWAHNTSGVCRN